MTTDRKLTCGLIMPISAIDGYSAEHWEEVRAIIRESLADTDFEIRLVSDSDDVGVIQKRIVQNIHDNDIVICDVSAKNPNVMFELGMRLAFDKPAIIIKDLETQYSFDTAPVEHLEYPRNLHYASINIFKARLREKTINTLNAAKDPNFTTFLGHFGKFVIAKVDEQTVGKEEFVMQAISDLRSEVLQLAKSVRPNETTNHKLHDRVNGSNSPVDAYLFSKLLAGEFDPKTAAENKLYREKLFDDFFQKLPSSRPYSRSEHLAIRQQFMNALNEFIPVAELV